MRCVIVRVLYRYDCVACDAGHLFKCHNTDRCIRADDYFCNGYDDCEDGSDEPVNCSEWYLYLTVVLDLGTIARQRRLPVSEKTKLQTHPRALALQLLLRNFRCKVSIITASNSTCSRFAVTDGSTNSIQGSQLTKSTTSHDSGEQLSWRTTVREQLYTSTKQPRQL